MFWLSLSALASSFAVVTSYKVCDISSYEPFGDGVQYDDEALESALSDCQDGGQIYFGPGKYLLSPFNLSSNMEIYLEEGVVLMATSDFDKWPVVEELPSYPPEVGRKC